ncbi:hypothetical protein G9A89_017294 [Geosiphon pyriformis]|nr:hypothetical protein G9A89_017294 [Geosiphon pyriformis]
MNQSQIRYSSIPFLQPQDYASVSTTDIFNNQFFNDSMDYPPPTHELAIKKSPLQDVLDDNCCDQTTTRISSNIQCHKCHEHIPWTKFIPATAKCTNKCNVCPACIKKHIEYEVMVRKTGIIWCPAGNECRGFMTEQDVQLFASNEVFKRFQQLVIPEIRSETKSIDVKDAANVEKETFSEIPGFKWCPNPACESGQIHEDGEKSPIMTCFLCGQRSCIIHDQRIESGHPCGKCISHYRTSMGEYPQPIQTQSGIENSTSAVQISTVRNSPLYTSPMTSKTSQRPSSTSWFPFEIREIFDSIKKDKGKSKQTFENSELMFWVCPNVDCGIEQIHEINESSFSTCKQCREISCVLHNRVIGNISACVDCDSDFVKRLMEEQGSQYASPSGDNSKTTKLNKGKGQALPIEIQSQKSTSYYEQKGNERLEQFQQIKASPVTQFPDYDLIVLAQTRECAICADEFPINQFLPVTIECAHEDNVCRECVSTHIKHELADKGNFRIICLGGGGCKIILQACDVQRFVDGETLERFHQLSVNSVLSQMEDFRWCKNPNCKAGQIHFEADYAPIMVCNACGQKSCAQHDMPVNPDVGCTECEKIRAAWLAEQEANELATKRFLEREEAEERERQATEAREREAARQELLRRQQEEAEAQERIRQERERAEEARRAEQATNNLIQSNTKACPRCKSKIEKNGGCNHMTCKAPGCGYEFCWICLARHGGPHNFPCRR